MHILLIHQAFAALNEAGGTRHHELARHLVARGHRVTIIASPVSYLTGQRQAAVRGGEQPEPGITILRASTYSALHKSFFHRLVSFFSFMLSSFWIGLRVQAVDLVWGTSPPIFQGVTALLLARIKRVPFVFEVRDLWPAFAIAVGVLRNPLLIRASLWLEKFLYRQARQVIVNSPGFLEHVRQHGARSIALIPNGAEPEMFQPDGSGGRFRAMHQLDGKFVVLYAGAHGLSNDLGVVLQAAARLEDHPQIHFLLVGDGKEKHRLQAQAASLHLSNVTFLPPVAKDRMSEVFAAADAGLAILKPLDLYRTTYPNKVFDCMAAARPVVLAIDGVIREVVEKAGAGIASAPGDPAALAEAVCRLANDPVAARAMGYAGLQYVQEHFNRRDLANRLAELFEEVGGQR